MNELRDLYQEVILDHKRHPRNFGPLEAASRSVEGYNPLCGDHFIVHVKVEDGIIRDVHFEGEGCAISTASASLMTEAVKGRPVAEALVLFDDVHRLLTIDAPVDSARLGKLAVLAGVREFPSRVKCAALAWHTLKAALEGHAESVSTE